MKIAVFCGSRLGAHDDYARDARLAGAALAREGIGLVYGGTHAGLMREVSQGAREAGGQVVGIMARGLGEVADADVTEMRSVGSLSERKALMAELSSGFLTLPGGMGTLDEWSEIVTWSMVGLHAKPVAILNTRGFYDEFLKFLDRAVEEGFWKAKYRDALLVDDNPERLVAQMKHAIESQAASTYETTAPQP
jgi:uncharacterized protein (TIGR00730 family)